MSGKDRRPYESATTLDQQLLDFCQDNLVQEIRMVAEIETDQGEARRVTVSISQASPAVVSNSDHRFIENEPIIFETDGTLPSPLVVDSPYYVRFAVSGQFNVSATDGGPLINTTTPGSGTHQASAYNALIRASDRNTYVGSKFFEARTNFPIIARTIGEWLSPTIEFSALNIRLNNVDANFSGILPAGENFSGMINKQIEIKQGLRDVESSYTTIFKGFVSDVGGFKRDIDVIEFIARDQFDKLNQQFPTEVLTLANFPRIAADKIGLVVPIIYGDWTTQVETWGNVPTILLNEKDPEINKEEHPVTISQASPAKVTFEDHRYDSDDKIRFTTDGTLPTPLATGTDYYIRNPSDDDFEVSLTPGGASINTTSAGSGNHNCISQDLENIKAIIANNALSDFDDTEVWLLRGSDFYQIAQADITNIHADKNYFEIIQDSGNTTIDASNLIYASSDLFYVKVKGEDLGAYDDNPVWQARHILLTYAGADSGEFDSNWETYRDKSTPSQSAIDAIKSRVWIQEPQSALEYSLSILEQVRLEAFISKDLKIKLNAMHFEDWTASPSHRIRNFDVIEGTAKLSIDEQNNFNRATAFYDFNPVSNENSRQSAVYRNQDAIDAADGKLISRKIEFPNLYVESDVTDQLQEILRIASGYGEIIDIHVTNRTLLQDIGGFVKFDVKIGSTEFDEVPCMIRNIGYSPDSRLVLKLLSLQMLPFSGYSPGYDGITGGHNATITEE